MKNEIILTDTNGWLDGIFNITLQYDNSFNITIYVGDNIPIEQLIKDKERFNKCVDSYLEVYDVEILEKLKSDFDHILDLIDYVRFDFEKLDQFEYLHNNPILKDKKIVISGSFKISDYEKIIGIEEKYDDYYIVLEGNYDYVKISDAKKTINIMNGYINKIKSLNLSPLERIMYAYDLVKNRVYNKEDTKDDALASRDLSQILLGDKIVCVGYTTLLQTILNCLDIKNMNLTIQDKKTPVGHMRNLIYVKDDKYKVDGIYCFDATWDSRKVNDDNKYINKYKYFAKTIDEMIVLEENKYDYGDMYYSENMYEEAKNILLSNSMLDDNNFNFLCTVAKYRRLLYANDDFFRKILFYQTFPNSDATDILKDLEIVRDKLNKPLNAETFLELVRNVRRIEYYTDPSLYLYTAEDICNSCLKAGFKFDKPIYNKAERLLMLIFGEQSHNRHELIDDIKSYYEQNSVEIEEDAKRLEFTKVLRKIYDTKK